MSGSDDNAAGGCGCVILIGLVLICGGAFNKSQRPAYTPSYNGRSSHTAPTSEPTVKEGGFKSDMEGIVTPFGAIDMSSVKEASDGDMTYTTSDGRTWKVKMTQDEDGRFHYSEPEEVE